VYYKRSINFFVQNPLCFTAPEKVYELRVVSGMNHDTEVDWTPPLNNPWNIRQYKITYQVSSQQITRNPTVLHRFFL
jgi:hypothetical protein